MTSRTDTHSVRSLAHEFYHRHLGRLRHALCYRPQPAGDGIKMIAIRPLARQRALSQRRTARRQSERHSGIALDLGLIACGDYLSYKKLKHERYKGDQGVILRQFHPRMTVDELHADVMQWLPNAKDRRWKRPYTDLTYLPMQEVLKYLRANGCRFCYF